jgi:hypothetical protein
MGKVFETLNEELESFLLKQHLFFVATAPLDVKGHVNLSPKGMDTFRVLSSTQVAYLDLTGSGNETSAHIFENGRITLMFCAFDGPPNIVRLYGQGKTILPESEEWSELAKEFIFYPGARQIILIEIHRVQTSCGYSIPFYDYKGERDTLIKWAESKGPDELDAYRAQKNVMSIDQKPTPLKPRNQNKLNSRE